MPPAVLQDGAPGISASPSEENARYFNVMIIGPTTSPYEGGVYKLELYLPEDYPMAAPKVRALSENGVPPLRCSISFSLFGFALRLPRGDPSLATTRLTP